MPAPYPIGIKLDENILKRLDRLSERRGRSRHWLLKEAVQIYIEREETAEKLRKETRERWAELESGDAVDNDTVMEWLDTWGTDEETECPV